MLVILRILFGAALVYALTMGAESAPGSGEVGDMTGPLYMVICVVLGILNALVWAPYLGAKLSMPLTGMLTSGEYVESTNWVSRGIHWAGRHRLRRLALFLCFWEGVRHPNSPFPFVAGLGHAREGSWLEKVFAREVFRFNNIQHCVRAYQALRRQGITPKTHPSQEVNAALLALDRPPRPEAEVLAVPPAPEAEAPKRNPQIRLFKRPGTENREG
jgi:hypothetical protein